MLTKADDNQITYNTILDSEENDIELTNSGYSVGSTGNRISYNEEIEIIKIINSDNNLLVAQDSTTINLVDSANVSAIGSTFDFVEDITIDTIGL